MCVKLKAPAAVILSQLLLVLLFSDKKLLLNPPSWSTQNRERRRSGCYQRTTEEEPACDLLLFAAPLIHVFMNYSLWNFPSSCWNILESLCVLLQPPSLILQRSFYFVGSAVLKASFLRPDILVFLSLLLGRWASLRVGSNLYNPTWKCLCGLLVA